MSQRCSNFPRSSHPGKSTREARRYLDHEPSYQTADGHGLPCESCFAFMQSKWRYYWNICPLFFVFFTYICITDASWFFLQRDPAEEALKSNNMNLDQAMSALLEKKTELDKRGMAITGHDYNSGLINKPMNCPRPPLLSKDPSADPRLPFMDKV